MKKIFSMLLLGSLMLCLIACGNKKEDSPAEIPAEETEEQAGENMEAPIEAEENNEEADSEAPLSTEETDSGNFELVEADTVTLKEGGVSVTLSLDPEKQQGMFEQSQPNLAGCQYFICELVTDNSLESFMDKAQNMFDSHLQYDTRCETRGCDISDIYTMETNIGEAFVRRCTINGDVSAIGQHSSRVFFYVAVPLDNDVTLLLYPSPWWESQFVSPYTMNWYEGEEMPVADDELASHLTTILKDCSVDK